MKRRSTVQYTAIIFTLLVSFIPLSPQVKDGGRDLLIRKVLSVDSRERTYNVYLPRTVKIKKGLPLMIVLHGAKGNGMRMFMWTGFHTLAEENGFIAVFPDAAGKYWNDGRIDRHSEPFINNVDDVKFISKLIDRLYRDYGINRRQVYLAGFSNGAMMCHRLGCMIPQKIAAMACVAGSLPKYLSFLNINKSLPVLIIHGTDDSIVPWMGGNIELGSQKRGHVLSVVDTVLFWAVKNECNMKPKIEVISDKKKKNEKMVLRITYANNKTGKEVVLIPIVGGGHVWPGAHLYGSDTSSSKIFRDISATDLIWNFCSKYYR